MNMTTNRWTSGWLAAVGFLLAVLAGPAQAYTSYTWTNTAGGSIGTAGNWSSAPTFDATAELLFASTNAPVTGSTITLDGDKTIGKLNISVGTPPSLPVSNAYTIAFAPGSPTTSKLTLQDLVYWIQKGTFNANYSCTIGYDLALAASSVWSNTFTTPGGTASLTLNLNGTLTSAGGTILTIAGAGNTLNFNGRVNAPEVLFSQSVNSVVNFNAASNAVRGVTFTGGTSTFIFGGNANTVGTNGVSLGGGNNHTITFSGGGNTFNGPIDINANGGLYLNGASNTVASNAILRNAGGKLRLGAQDALGAAVLTNSAGIVQLAGNHAVHNTFNMGGNLTLAPLSGVVTYDGTLGTFAPGRSLIVSGTDGVLRFNPAGGLNNNTNSLTGGALEVAASGITLPGGPLTVSGGVLLLNGLSWSDWLAQRAYGAGNGQWQFSSGGFAARGTNAVSIASPAGFLDNRLTRLGSIAKDGSGATYANAPVDVALDLVMTGRQTVAVSETGPGFTRAPTSGVIHTISGNITGAGVPTFTYQVGQSDPETAEVILSGTNSAWNGSAYVSGGGGSGMNSGPGGMLANRALVRFAGPAALPNGGTPGALRYLVANGVGGGYMLAGSPGGQTYDLGTTRNGYRFMIFCTGIGTVLGADGGIVTLQNSLVQMHNANNGDGSAGPTLLVRKGSVFNLGSPGAPLMWVRSFKAAETDGGLSASPTAPTQGASVRVIYKRGEGTVVLKNVQFKLLDGTTDESLVSTAWQIGRGVGGNMGANAYFDGAVRETGTNNSNSVVNRLMLAGGVLESTGTISRTVNNNAGSIQWDLGGGGGFAAFGGNLDVSITSFSTGNTTNTPLIWGSTSRFILATDALIFGSYTADARVDFKNALRLDAVGNGTVGTREIRILDNTNSTADVARFSGAIAGTANTTLSKAGDGVLEMTSITNLYAGPTAVNAGTLLVNGSLNAGGGVVTVAGGGTLGGTGTISRAVTVSTNGAITAGAQLSGDIGVLTVNGDVNLAENAKVLVDFTSTTNDRVQVNGTLTLPAAATVTVSTVGDPGALKSRVLFSASALAGSTGELTQWVLSDPKLGRIVTQGNNVVLLSKGAGTLILVR